MSMWAGIVTASGAIGMVVAAIFTARATTRAAKATARANEAAARAAAEPQSEATRFAVLEATVKRVDEENGQLRGRQSRLEALLRAFASTADRWCRQMVRAGIEPEPAHPLVEEYNRTGV